MKIILWSIITAFIATQLSLSAEPITVTNTSGTELTVEIQTLEGNQLTFVRTSDKQEFTIPLSMLDEPSQKKIDAWELKTKYQPDSAPFFKMGDQYVIPIEITAQNSLTYYDSNSKLQTSNFSEAPKLKNLAEENKKGLRESGTGMEGIVSVTNGRDKILNVKNGVVVLSEQGSKTQIIKDQHNPYNPDDAQLNEITYETFLPKAIELEQPSNRFIRFFSMAPSTKDHPLYQMFFNREVNGDIRGKIPSNLKPGEWVKNKTIVRIFRGATNLVYISKVENTPVGIRNVKFKPVKPEKSLLTIEDLEQGYNFFTSPSPFTLEKTSRGVKIDAEEPIRFRLSLDAGYEVEIVTEYENGSIEEDSMHVEINKNSDLRIANRSMGSREESIITFKGYGLFTEIIIKPNARDPMILHRFDVSISKARNAAKLNPLHQ